MTAPGPFITARTATPFLARRSLSITKPLLHAEASVCGLGQFIFYINGHKISDHELDPAWTNYRKYVPFVTFDVTDALTKGENVIAAEVGNGWFIKDDTHYTFRLPEFMGKNPNPYRPFHDSLLLAVRLNLTYQDGSTEEITADDSFRVAPAFTVMSNVYGSETYDASLLQPGWNNCGFDDSTWRAAEKVHPSDLRLGVFLEQTMPPVKVIRTHPAVFLHAVGSRRIYDFGCNISAMLDFTLTGPAGSVIRIYPAEKLTADGDVDQVAKGWTTVNSCITAILGNIGTPQHFRMRFTYFAGRYAAVEADWENVSVSDLHADAISSAWKEAGSFSCDDIRYRKIYDLVERAVEANMVSVHTDCPTIERFAWQEPNHLMAPSILFMKDGRGLWEKFLLDMRMEQHSAADIFYDYSGTSFPAGDGLIPSQCPCYIPNVLPVPGMGSFYDIIAWGSALILGARWHYRFYGDPKIIADNYEAGARYFHYLSTKCTPEGFISHGLGDWGHPRGEYARENIETAFYYADAMAMAEFAGLLGKAADAAFYRELAGKVRERYNRALLVTDPSTGRKCYRVWEHKDSIFMTQAAEALPLYFGLVPEEDETDVKNTLHELLLRDEAFVCGEIGLPYVIQTAHTCEWDDLISTFILRPEHPSYYAFVLAGETTLGEYWEDNPRSHCHDMMGHIIEWYYNGIAGIESLSPGFQTLRIRPYLPEGMHQFNCRYDSVRGPIEVTVREEEDAVYLCCKTPAHVPCEILSDRLEKRGKPVILKTGKEEQSHEV